MRRESQVKIGQSPSSFTAENVERQNAAVDWAQEDGENVCPFAVLHDPISDAAVFAESTGVRGVTRRTSI